MCYELRILEDTKDIIQYKQEWIELELYDSERTIFQSYDWIKKYCEFLLNDKCAKFFMFFLKKKLVGVFPMQLRKFRGIIIYEFMGSCGVDYIMPLIMDLHKEKIYEEFCNWMEVQSDNVVFVFENIPHIHSFSKYFRKHDSLQLVLECYELCPYYIINLPDTWEKYKDGLSKRMRYEIEYDRRYIDKNIRSEFIELDISRIDEHIALNQERMHERQIVSPFDFESSYLFWKKYFSDEFFKKRLKIQALICETDIVASIISLDVNQRKYILSLNINLKYKQYSPGNVLLGYIIEEAINAKIKSFDLGRGRDQYKLRFGATEYFNDRIIVNKNIEKQKQYNRYVFYLYDKIGYYLTDE